ncbi:MAG: hypothetical protein IKH23_03725 [Clostridiales bacterium]|nr:hypothetical protein [Clostridiales bacterium]
MEMELDMKSIVFIIVFVIAGGLAVLGCYSIAYEGQTITSVKPLMDFAFAIIVGALAIAQYKIFEAAEKA